MDMNDPRIEGGIHCGAAADPSGDLTVRCGAVAVHHLRIGGREVALCRRHGDDWLGL